eukprot:1195273-Prorocentrum_minimum.AAC.5
MPHVERYRATVEPSRVERYRATVELGRAKPSRAERSARRASLERQNQSAHRSASPPALRRRCRTRTDCRTRQPLPSAPLSRPPLATPHSTPTAPPCWCCRPPGRGRSRGW